MVAASLSVNKVIAASLSVNKVVAASLSVNKVVAASLSVYKVIVNSWFKCIQADCDMGAQWLSGRVLDSRQRGRGFEPHRRHCDVVL